MFRYGCQHQMRLRPKRSFHCRSRLPCDGLGQWARWSVLVAVQLSVPGLYLPPVFKISSRLVSTPDDHFTAGPDCRVTDSAQWARWWCWWPSNYPCRDCISRRCSSNGHDIISAPDDHFTAGPDCRVTVSASGRVGGAGGCPTIRAGIVSPAGVQSTPESVPPQTIISLPVQTAV